MRTGERISKCKPVYPPPPNFFTCYMSPYLLTYRYSGIPQLTRVFTEASSMLRRAVKRRRTIQMFSRPSVGKFAIFEPAVARNRHCHIQTSSICWKKHFRRFARSQSSRSRKGKTENRRSR